MAMNRTISCALYEHNLCARRIQLAWTIYKFYKYETDTMVPRAVRRMEVCFPLVCFCPQVFTAPTPAAVRPDQSGSQQVLAAPRVGVDEAE